MVNCYVAKLNQKHSGADIKNDQVLHLGLVAVFECAFYGLCRHA